MMCQAKLCEKLTERINKMFIKSKTRKISIHDADVVSEEENEVRTLFYADFELMPFLTNRF